MGSLNLVFCTLATASIALAGKPDMTLVKKIGYEKLDTFTEAHAVLGSLAWVILIPIGAILFSLLKVPHLFWIHSTVQTIGLLCLIPSFTLGVIMGLAYGKLFDNVHTIMGTIVFAIALIQPVWGILQHRAYMKTGKKTLWGLAHKWLGRITITAAIINGGLGFILTKGYPSYSKGGLIAYIVVSSVMWSIFVAAILFETVRGKRNEVSRKTSQRTGSENSADYEVRELSTSY